MDSANYVPITELPPIQALASSHMRAPLLPDVPTPPLATGAGAHLANQQLGPTLHHGGGKGLVHYIVSDPDFIHLLFGRMVEGGVLFAVADAGAQWIERRYLRDARHHDEDDGPDGHDWARTCRMAIWGTYFFAPLMFVWYAVLEAVVPGGTLELALIRVALDQLLCSPFSISTFFFVVAILSNKSAEKSFQEAHDQFWPALKLNWVLWPIVQVGGFLLAPDVHVTLVLMVNIPWCAVLSIMSSGYSISDLLGLRGASSDDAGSGAKGGENGGSADIFADDDLGDDDEQPLLG